jgi:hypothetical protein
MHAILHSDIIHGRELVSSKASFPAHYVLQMDALMSPPLLKRAFVDALTVESVGDDPNIFNDAPEEIRNLIGSQSMQQGDYQQIEQVTVTCSFCR